MKPGRAKLRPERASSRAWSAKIRPGRAHEGAWMAKGGGTYGRTDGWTDGRTDGRTDRPSYRDARTQLKTAKTFIDLTVQNEPPSNASKKVSVKVSDENDCMSRARDWAVHA